MIFFLLEKSVMKFRNCVRKVKNSQAITKGLVWKAYSAQFLADFDEITCNYRKQANF